MHKKVYVKLVYLESLIYISKTAKSKKEIKYRGQKPVHSGMRSETACAWRQIKDDAREKISCTL